MHPKYPNVFQPMKIGPVEVDNRFYFAPHGINMAYGRNEPSNDFVAYSSARARGGCGLLIQSLHVHGKLPNSCSPWPEENIPSFTALADAIHHEGGKVFGQLFYFWGGSGQWWPLAPSRPALTPSTMQQNWNNEATHPMTREEMRSFIDAYRQSAAHLRQAGYDGVEVHVSHGTMIEQFNSPYFNRRRDEYGGSLENRLRFALECLQAAREGAGDQMAVGIRFNCDELLPGGYDTDGGREILGRLCGSGLVDFADLDVAVEPNQFWLGMPSMFVDKHPYRSYVEAVRDATGDVPVLSVIGRVHSIQEAEDLLAAGVTDMVGTARALITEPNLVKNARDGNEHLSRTCISCNHCMEYAMTGNLVCSMNPATFRERLWGEDTLASHTATPSKVVVVGGGAAGLEAARVAATKGHDVVLLEARDQLGGGLRVWATMPGRQTLQLGVDWWADELRRLGVDVRLGTEATAEAVLAEQPDAVIVATGSTYSRTGHSGFLNQPIAGHDRDLVFTPEDYLLRGHRPSGKVVVLDAEGLHTSVGITEMLAADGVQVELVTPAFAPVSMNLMFSQEVGFIIGRLKAAGVTLSTSTWARSIGDSSVTVYDVFNEQERTVDGVDAVLLVTTREPNDSLTAQLEGKVKQLFTAGDALAPRALYAASYEGQMFARFIGEPGAPATFNEAYWPEPDRALLTGPAAMRVGEPAVAGSGA